MKKIILLLASPAILFLASCGGSKTEETAVAIPGMMEVELKINGNALSIMVPDSTKGNLTTPFTYNIQEKGKKINIKFSLLGFITEMNGTIEEQTDTKFVYSFTSPTGGEKVTETLTKN